MRQRRHLRSTRYSRMVRTSGSSRHPNSCMKVYCWHYSDGQGGGRTPHSACIQACVHACTQNTVLIFLVPIDPFLIRWFLWVLNCNCSALLLLVPRCTGRQQARASTRSSCPASLPTTGVGPCRFQSRRMNRSLFGRVIAGVLEIDHFHALSQS